jgi:hypothetical protein
MELIAFTMSGEVVRVKIHDLPVPSKQSTSVFRRFITLGPATERVGAHPAVEW